jgi:hypothetical protein
MPYGTSIALNLKLSPRHIGGGCSIIRFFEIKKRQVRVGITWRRLTLQPTPRSKRLQKNSII